MATKPKTSYLKELQEAAKNAGMYKKRTLQAYQWFYDRVKNKSRINPKNYLKDPKLYQRVNPFAGAMYHFLYDAKHKDTLLYFDKFPLIFFVGPAKDGFYGINLHYLPPVVRAHFFDKITLFTNNDRWDVTTRLRMNYGLLKSTVRLKEFKPCFKHYLFQHLRSPMYQIFAPEWVPAMLMPTDQFVYQNRRTIWKKSLLAIN